ncbi:MAG: hypothetical protein RLZZ58_389 [Pseudomonadota bacterium]|jgi:hypothetical protein
MQDIVRTPLGRRQLLTAGAAALPLILLPGCASMGGVSLTEAIRRLLSLSSQRAFATLIAPNGFLDSSVARINLPPQLGGDGATSLLAALLRSGPVKDRLVKQVNRAAEKGAEIAAPMVADAITSVSIADAAAIVRGGPTAATDLLQAAMGEALFTAMIPGVDQGLRLFDSAVVNDALRVATGIDFAGLTRDVSGRASRAIYRAIGTEESAIRANPQATNDPLLIAVFGIL